NSDEVTENGDGGEPSGVRSVADGAVRVASPGPELTVGIDRRAVESSGRDETGDDEVCAPYRARGDAGGPRAHLQDFRAVDDQVPVGWHQRITGRGVDACRGVAQRGACRSGDRDSLLRREEADRGTDRRRRGRARG